jgi:4-carboxymuconolactone decarboxylase
MPSHHREPQYYRIRVRGHLGATICSAFPALAPRTVGADTVLAGELADQAALYGVLAEIEALGLVLVAVCCCEAREAGVLLPPAPPTGLTAEQRTLRDILDAMTEAEKCRGLEVKNSDGAFVGPWGALLRFPDLARPLCQFIGLTQRLPGLSERARQVVILTIGAHFNVAYGLSAHAFLTAHAGLRSDQIAALSVGARPADLSEDELLAADVALALARGGAVPGPLYDTAVARFGRQGFDAVVFITIHYLVLGALLNAYNVPAGNAAAHRERP